MKNKILIFLKKNIRKYLSIQFIILISLIKTFKIKNQKIVESQINLGSSWNLLYKLSDLDREVLISAESNKLIFYRISNQGIESFEINSISRVISLEPNDGLTYVVLSILNLKRYLLVDLYTKRFLYFLVNKNSEKKYLLECIKTIKNELKNLKNAETLDNKGLNIFNYRYEGSIQYFKNLENSNHKLEFKESIIIANRREISFKSRDKKKIDLKRILIFYLDNISFGTARIIKGNKDLFPNLSNIFNDESCVSFSNSMSISNWTYPAAISFLTGIPFERHKKYYPWEKNFLGLINKVYNSPNRRSLDIILENFKLRFRAGSNWRMLQHHGLHSIFTHCMSHPKMADIYSASSQVFKQLDIAGNESSLHWIDVMDTHHPVKNSILPEGSLTLSGNTIKSGLHYENGAKYKYGQHLNSTREIYIAQIKSIDNFIGETLNRSFKKIPKDNHLIAFVSDHGTHVMHDGNPFSRNLELHNPMIKIIPNKENIEYFKNASDLPFAPWNFMPLLDYSFSGSEGFLKYKSTCANFPYSQIIYPNQKYNLLILFSQKQIYKFESDKLIPNKIIEDDIELDLFIKESLQNGVWKLLNEMKENIVSKDDLPQNIKNFIYFLIHN